MTGSIGDDRSLRRNPTPPPPYTPSPNTTPLATGTQHTHSTVFPSHLPRANTSSSNIDGNRTSILTVSDILVSDGFQDEKPLRVGSVEKISTAHTVRAGYGQGYRDENRLGYGDDNQAVGRTQDVRRLKSEPSLGLLNDPRANSQQSIHQAKPLEEVTPTLKSRNRNLLLIYIHGFLGTDLSFNHFPAHLHNLLTLLFSQSLPSYTVHTKVFPRFKTRYSILEAAEMFSQWLADSEADDTDIVLLGHSMGGILAGEVATLAPLHQVEPVGFLVDGRRKIRYRHRILGVVGFDTPFLGLYPGILASGLSSLFGSAPSKPKNTRHQSFSQSNTPENITSNAKPEYYNAGSVYPPKRLPMNHHSSGVTGETSRYTYESDQGGLANFLYKHWSNLPQATVQYFKGHLEYGACLVDPVGLYKRYRRLRALEDGDQDGNRVRFVNFYTVCFGYEKQSEGLGLKSRSMTPSVAERLGDISLTSSSRLHGPRAQNQHQSTRLSSEKDQRPTTPSSISAHILTPETTPSPSIKDDESEYSEDDSTAFTDKASLSPPQSPTSVDLSSHPNSPDQLPPYIVTLNARSAIYNLPPLSPPRNEQPIHPGISHITDSKLHKVANKEYKKAWKEYYGREKAWIKTVKGREKSLAKIEKAEIKAAIKGGKTREKMEAKMEKLEEKIRAKGECRHDNRDECSGNRSSTKPNYKSYSERGRYAHNYAGQYSEKVKEKKERKFCILPSAVKESGDPTWVKVYMHNVDEVDAHCGLFLSRTEGLQFESSTSSPASEERCEEHEDDRRTEEIRRRQYEELVGDAAWRIEGWVKGHFANLEALEVAENRVVTNA